MALAEHTPVGAARSEVSKSRHRRTRGALATGNVTANVILYSCVKHRYCPSYWLGNQFQHMLNYGEITKALCRFCADEDEDLSVVSKTNRVPIMTFSRSGKTVIKLQYRYGNIAALISAQLLLDCIRAHIQWLTGSQDQNQSRQLHRPPVTHSALHLVSVARIRWAHCKHFPRRQWITGELLSWKAFIRFMLTDVQRSRAQFAISLQSRFLTRTGGTSARRRVDYVANHALNNKLSCIHIT